MYWITYFLLTRTLVLTLRSQQHNDYVYLQNNLSKYLTVFDCRTRNKEFNTISMIDLTDDSCGGFFDTFLKTTKTPKILNVLPSPMITEYVAFTRNVTSVNAYLHLWRTQKNVHLIICDRIKNPEIVRNLLATLSARKILNYVIVYVDSDLKIITYNPFEDKILILKNRKCQKLFGNKLKNVHGHVIKVAMFDNPPSLKKVNGGWWGKDFELLKLVIFALNATLEVVESGPSLDFEGVAILLENKMAEFSFQGFLQAHDFAHLDAFNPHVMDGIVALIPKSTKLVTTILKIFDTKIWLALLFLTAVIVAIIKLFRKLHLDKVTATFRFLLLSTTVICLIFLTVFQSTMSSTLTQTRFEENIKNCEDLKMSKLPIVTFPRFYRIVSRMHKDLSSQMTVIDKRHMYKMIQNGDDTKAYILPYFVAEEFVRIRKQGEEIYSVMEEMLVPSHRVFLFRHYSPYLKEIEKIVLHLREAGFMHKVYEMDEFEEEEFESVYLTMKHLKSVFLMLSIGWSIGCVIFLYEIVKGKLNLDRKFAELDLVSKK